MQHSAAVPTVSAVTVAAGLAFVFVVSVVHTKSAPQVPGVGAVQHSAAVPTVSAVTVAAGLAFVFVASAVHTKSAPQVPGSPVQQVLHLLPR